MAIPLALMAVGTGVQIAGQWLSNWEMAQQERQNAQFYRDQAELARLSSMREEQLAEFDYTYKVGQQVSDYAAAGVDISGSAATTIGGSIKNMIDEIWAIKKKGDMDVKLASMRGEAAGKRASTLASPVYNLLQAGTTLTRAYAGSEGFGKGFPSWMGPSVPTPSNTSGVFKYFPENNVSGAAPGPFSYQSQYFGPIIGGSK